MIEIIKNKDGSIANGDEIRQELEKLTKEEIPKKCMYYTDRYFKKVMNALYENRGKVFSKLIDTRKINLLGEDILFLIYAGRNEAVEGCKIDTVVSLKDKRNHILLFPTTGPCLGYDGVGVKFGKIGAIPIVIGNHFVSRFLERHTYSPTWMASMIEELDITNQVINGSFIKDTEKEIKVDTNSLIEAGTDMLSGLEADEINSIMTGGGFRRSKSGGLYIMKRPRRGGLYSVITYIPKYMLKGKQKELLSYQKGWFEIDRMFTPAEDQIRNW